MQIRSMTLGGVLSAVVIALVAQAASSLAHAEPGAAAARQATIAQQPPSAELRYDESGRPVISTQVNGKGPFDMVVDTAAQTTFLAPGLVEELQLTPLQTDQNISGASGQAQVRTYPLSSLSSDLFSVEGTVAPGLPNASVTQARGVIGMDLFLQRRLVFDREAGRLFATASGTMGAGFASHAGRAFAGNFIIVPVMLDGVPVQAVIDSGAARTIANDAARSALGYTQNDPRLSETHAVRGATEDATEAHRSSVAVFDIGPARFEDVFVTFSNLPVFRVLGLADQPALILGSDVLNRLPAYAVDFPRAELQMRIPESAPIAGSGARQE